MASQAIKEYDDFAGTNGYLIVDGLDEQTLGGKLKVPNYSGVTDGYVLTKTTTNGSDDVVWSAPAGGGGLPDASSLIGKTYNYTDEVSATTSELRVVYDLRASGGTIISASNVRWQYYWGSAGEWYDV